MFDDVVVHLGGLEVRVNNAGNAGPTGPVKDIRSLHPFVRHYGRDQTAQIIVGNGVCSGTGVCKPDALV